MLIVAVAALLAAKARITADPSGALATWKRGSYPCGASLHNGTSVGAWQHLSCDAPGGSVVEINLANAGLSGRLADELIDLANITKL